MDGLTNLVLIIPQMKFRDVLNIVSIFVVKKVLGKENQHFDTCRINVVLQKHVASVGRYYLVNIIVVTIAIHKKITMKIMLPLQDMLLLRIMSLLMMMMMNNKIVLYFFSYK